MYVPYSPQLSRPALLFTRGKPLHPLTLSSLNQFQIWWVVLSDCFWLKASLPVSLGGLGTRQASMHAPAAFLASLD